MSLIGVLDLFRSNCTVSSCYQPRYHPASVYGSHSSFCPASTTDMKVKKEMHDSGCFLSRGSAGSQVLWCCPEQGPWIWSFSAPMKLCSGLQSLGTEENTGFQWRRNIVYLSRLFKVFLEKQRLAYIKVAHKKLPVILNMKICQELHAEWICIHQSCTYSTQLGILNCIKNGNTEFLDADNWILEKHTQTCTQLWHLLHLSYLDG